MSLEVHWYEGLFLQPHHLQLMQRDFRQRLEWERRLAWHYPYGLIEADLSKDELEKSTLVFNALRVVMRSGLDVRVPENAILPSLEIDSALAQSGGSLTVYLGVPRFFPDRANAFKSGQEVDPRVKLRHRLKENDVLDENTGENPRTVQFRMLNARLLLQAEADEFLAQPPDKSDMEVMPLLRVKRATNVDTDLPRVDSDFVPPCLVLRGSPVLYRLVSDLVAKIEATRKELEVQVARGGMGLETKLEMTQRLRTLNRFSARLAPLVAAPALTPFEMYLELRELLGELTALQPAKKMFDGAPYAHDKPYACFEELDEKIRSLIKIEGVEPLKVLFQTEDGRPSAAFNGEHFTKPNGWYLGIKTKAERTALAIYVKDADRFKLMPKSRANSALFGVELREENFPPQDLPAQADLHYFRVLANDESLRWQEIKEEKAAVLIWNNAEFDLSDAAFTLYMTLPSSSSRP